MKKLLCLVGGCCLWQCALGQVSDNFSDGDYISGPVWEGDDAKFEVAGEKLHLNDAGAGEAYLTTPSEAIADAEWRFTVEIDVNPSAANYTSVYLVSDQANLAGSLLGYFVKIGGADDEVSLCRQDGSTSATIIDGADGRVDLASVRIEVKVTRDARGNWELYSRVAGESDYTSEGSVRDATHLTAGYFGVYCQYTSTRSDAFYFDDISVVGVPQPDVFRPWLSTFSVLSDNQLLLQFSEAVTSATATDPGNYTLSDYSMEAALVGESEVKLTLHPALENVSNHSLRISNLQDNAGNRMTDTTLTFFYFDPVAPRWNDVVVSELMPDPNPVKDRLPDAEYIELYNRSEHPFDLGGWSLNGKSLPDSFFLRPKEYVILSAASDSAMFAPYGDVVPLSRWPSLANSGTTLVLMDDAGTPVDSVAYSATAVIGGISLERIRGMAPCDQRANLAATRADLGGTPGQASTVAVAAPDTIPPQLLQVTPIHEQQLQLLFDERVADEGLLPSSVRVMPAGTVVSIRRLATDERMVEVNLSEAMLNDTTYSVTFLGAQDCYGNIRPSQTRSVYFDKQPPALVQAIVRDTSLLQLVFSEKIIPPGKDSFRIDSVRVPKSIVFSEDSTEVTLLFPRSLADDRDHRLALSHLSDPFGNTADSREATVRYRQAIDTVRVISEYQVEVHLKENVNPETAASTEYFSVNRGVGAPQESWVDSRQPNVLQWVLSQPLVANQEHELTIRRLYDAHHQLLPTPLYRFNYDRRPPDLDSVVAISERTLLCYFDEALAPALAANPRHYRLPSQEAVVEATLLEDQRVVQLRLATSLVPETEYELEVVGLVDRSDNMMSDSKSRRFIYDQHPPRLASWTIVNPYELRLLFSEAVVPNTTNDYSVTTLGSPDRLLVSVIEPREVRLFFSQPLAFDTAVLTIDQLTDRRGNGLEQPVTATLMNSETSLGAITVLGPTQLRMDFTRALHPPAMDQTVRYRLDQSRHPTEVRVDHDRPYTVRLTFDPPLPANTAHTLSVDSIISEAGITSTGTIDSFRYQTQVAVVETEPQSIVLRFEVPLDSGTAGEVGHYQLSGTSPVAARLMDAHTVRLLLARPLEPLTRYELTLHSLLTADQDLIPSSVHTVGLGRPPAYNELIITEIMADPAPGVGLPEVEYVEFYNASSDLISTAGLQFSDETSSVRLPPTLLVPGEYLIVGASADLSTLAPLGRALGVSSFPTLNSAGDRLRLEDALGLEVFSVQYTDDWYNDAEKKRGGWSLEMVDPARPCGEANNWTASQAEVGGTPGQENSVFQSNPDSRSPELSEVFAVSDSVIRLRFSEKIAPESTSQLRLRLSPDLTADTVRWEKDRKTAYVRLAGTLQPRVDYRVTVVALTDCSGNPVDETPVVFQLSESAEAGDVLLSELLFHPRSGGTRFVEIYNASDKLINLRGWELANLSGDSLVNRTPVAADDYPLGPQQYLALTEDAVTLRGDYPAASAGHQLEVTDLPSLPADAGEVVLVAPSGERMQRLPYDERWHHPVLTETRGVSLERLHWDAPVDDRNNWQSAARTAGGATPGYANSQAASGAESQHHLWVAPRVFTPDQDGFQDFTQIHYRWPGAGQVANVIIFNSRGEPVRHLARNLTLAEEGFLRWDGADDQHRMVAMGYYLIYFEVFHTNGQVSVLKERVVVGTPF